MSGEPQLFRVDPKTWKSDRIKEVNFAQLGLRERRDIQEWVAANPSILGDELLIINKEFSGFDRTNERLDLLAVGRDGRLVVIELKRDDTGADVHWQAIKYASYFQRATADDIVEMTAAYWKESQDDAVNRLRQHLEAADELDSLNRNQRIILVSHRFAPEVTSAAHWLNQQVPTKDIMTCVKLTPYQDSEKEALYVQASTILPVPGVDDLLIGVDVGIGSGSEVVMGGFKAKLRATFAKNQNDEVTRFLRGVGQLVKDGLAEDVIRPDITNKWAGQGFGGRYYHLWYKGRQPWKCYECSYRIHLFPTEVDGIWRAEVIFADYNAIQEALADDIIHPKQSLTPSRITADVGTDELTEKFAGKIAGVVCQFVEKITPIVDKLANAPDEIN